MQLQSSSLPSADNYAELLSLWHSLEGKRFSTPSEYRWSDGEDRPLGYHRKGYLGISKTTQGDIDLRYHQTIVVKWRPDDTCRVDLSYESLSTKTFAECFLPAGVEIGLDNRSNWTSDGAILGLMRGAERETWRDGGGYTRRQHTWHRVPSVFDLKVHDETVDWGHGCRTPRVDLITQSLPFETTKLNRKRARAALATTNYAAFGDWLAPWYSAVKPTLRTSVSAFVGLPPTWLRSLANPDEWPVLRELIKRGWSDVKLMRELRDAIYAVSDVYDTTQHDVAPSRATAMKWMRS